ncbi:type II toxin-antitoxin system death-on-curing family toxin [Vogesella sp. LIG4]|uniref:type II toxin-antitoxin system death-on-curing family toxin n=1 Tax=Vogesella sp. LIG4 TaxID=1192162 RepID=UPI00081F8FBC|nr:type II toxin-antitoxin system death-on-curing family toxin [Vogesella sp. LIG4]SCK11708.1 death on curing protein [Vogesella sp. LIG4]
MDEHQGLKFFYFDAGHAEQVHDWIIENSGGLPGTKSRHHLESPLAHIQNDDYYPEMADKLAFLIYAINKNHAFHDGNKRSSIALGAYFLELNGYDYVVRRFVLEMENIAVYVAANAIDRQLLRRIVESLMYEEDYSEALKLDLITAISSYVGEE